MVDGEIEPCDYALFADTQDEPAWVYKQLEWCESLGGPLIVRVTAGRVGDDLIHGRNSTGGRFASIPAHTAYADGQPGGLTRRQCTREYKIEPIERWVRRDLLGLKPKQRIPTDAHITSLFGFSTDESNRAVKMRKQFSGRARWDVEFPLFHDEVLMTRRDCQVFIDERSGFGWRGSRCVFCPLQMNVHHREIKQHDPPGFQRSIFVDDALRTTGTVANRDMDENMYIHRSRRPLKEANLDEGQQRMFQQDGECDEGCFT